jgi:xylan 1,4-beta-xylosidase
MIYKDININAAGERKPFAHFFRATGYANADYTYTPPLRRMYDYLASYRGHPLYMRLHNVLTLHGRGDYYIYNEGQDYGNPRNNSGANVDVVVSRDSAGKLRFNWEVVDRVYDIILDHGMRPIVETVYMPSVICAPGEIVFPENFGLWEEVVGTFARHWIERYGAEEVRQWYFEVWNEPDNHREWNEDPSAFFALYDYFEHALHAVDQDLKAGGPAVKQWEAGQRIFKLFLDHCDHGVNFKTGAYGARVDFISVHCKGGNPSLVGPSIDYMFNPLLDFIKAMKEYPRFEHTEFFNDESDIVWDGNRGIDHKSWLNFRNTHYAPAFTAKMVSRYCDAVLDAGVNLTVVDSDNSHLLWEKSFFSGNRSQLTPLGPVPCVDLIRKPIFNIFPLLGRLGDERYIIKPDDPEFGEKYGLLATRYVEGGYAFLLWNCEDGLLDDVNERTIRLHVENLEEAYDLLQIRLDNEHGSAYGEWVRMGRPYPLSRGQIRILREKDGLALAQPPEPVTSTDHFDLECTLPMHGVCLTLLVKRNSPRNAPAEQPGKPELQRETGASGNQQVFIRWNFSQRYDLAGYKIFRRAAE